MATPNSGTWHMANRLAKGHLADLILRLRDEGQSWSRMVVTLRIDYGVDVHAVTLADWHRQLLSGDGVGPQVPPSTPATGTTPDEPTPEASR